MSRVYNFSLTPQVNHRGSQKRLTEQMVDYRGLGHVR